MKKQEALKKCMRICSNREYCRFDINQKLKQWEVEPEDIEKIIEELENNNFINNLRYTEAFVNDKIKFNGWGKIKVRFYLKQKQIDEHIISDVLNKFNEQCYYDILEKETNKKLKSVKAINAIEMKNKTAKHLINRGFETNLVFSIINKKTSST